MDQPNPSNGKVDKLDAPRAGRRQRKVGLGKIDLSYENKASTRNGSIRPLEASDLARMVAGSPRFRAESFSSMEENRHVEKRKLKRLCFKLIRKVFTISKNCIAGSDWLFLATLGFGMALFSFAMDDCIDKIVMARNLIYQAAGDNVGIQYLAWTGPKLVLVLISSILCQFVAPQATGSGLPEMKTILRGVVLREYLTFKALVVKAIALTLCLGSGIPIGKEGPFVHICSIMATLLMKLMASFRKSYENESVRTDMLAAACAVGVACTFGAPIGGVLFSIEVTSVYFAVRNYWRGFFAATCSAILFRMTAVWFKFEPSPVAFTQTTFSTSLPFQSEELIIYALIGVFCGLTGPFFVIVHRQITCVIKNDGWVLRVLTKNQFTRLIYPIVVVLIISSVTFPPGLGQFSVSMLTPKAAIGDFFSNFSWNPIDAINDTKQSQVYERWTPMDVPFFATLTIYALISFFTACIANTLPIPTGVFIPTFVVGAAFGRIVGEFIDLYCPDGLFGGGRIVPGSYALVGAAAFTGAVTHTFSTSVIVFELTGQIVYILPVMVAVLLANTIAAYIQPSVFESIIKIKKLPYLPAMLPIESKAHSILVKQFMTPREDLKFISMDTTLREVREILEALPRCRAFPFVDSATSMILLGSIPRAQLLQQLDEAIGDEARCNAAKRMRQRAIDERLIESIVAANRSRVRQSSAEELGIPTRKTSAPDVLRENGKKFEVKPVSDRMGARRHSEEVIAGESMIVEETPKWIDPRITHAFNRLLANFGLMKKQFDETSPEEQELTVEERLEWESAQLSAKVNFHELQVDNAPIQLVERTSLQKAHSLFSLLSLDRAFVTRMGRLVGVVGLSDIRRALEERTQMFQEAEKHDDGEVDGEEEGERKRRRQSKTGGLEGLIDVALQPIRARKHRMIAPDLMRYSGVKVIDEMAREKSRDKSETDVRL